MRLLLGLLRIEYLAGNENHSLSLRKRLEIFYYHINQYEEYLSYYFLEQLEKLQAHRLIGINSASITERTPTFALTFNSYSPKDLASNLVIIIFAHGMGTFMH